MCSWPVWRPVPDDASDPWRRFAASRRQASPRPPGRWTYFPPSESLALAHRPRVEVTITATLSHVLPEPSLSDLGGLWSFWQFAVHALDEARA
jgi:hypothetical protein